MNRSPSVVGNRGFGKWILVGVAGVMCLIAWWNSRSAFYVNYLAAVMLPWSVAIGSLSLMLIFGLTGGRWARAAWPWLAINVRLMPWVAVAFLPVLIGATEIYPWASTDILMRFENTANRQWYFQWPFFVGRSVLYFAVWSALARYVTGANRRQPASVPGDPFRARSAISDPCLAINQAVAGLGLIAILLTVTWAGIDWVMSFDPFFTSTLFGALIGVGGMLSGISAAVAAVCFWLPLADPNKSWAGERGGSKPVLGDLSSLLLAFLMLWAYFSFAHWLIMWTGNLPQEASFYTIRNEGEWRWLTPVVCVVGFVVPFLCLLNYRFKRTPSKVGWLAVGMLGIRQIELCWMILPAGGQSFSGFHWSIVPSIALVSGAYSVALARQMQLYQLELQEGPNAN